MTQKMQEIVELDNEWIELIMNARSMGITIEEVRLFLNEVNKQQCLKEKE
ncbi:anti-repressor SinI family protein [Paenibacillus sp. Soil787]|nr:anti-repressor SinI family protein [Paenibacillus sp. Soil787]